MAINTFAGFTNAIEFAYGCAGSSAPALQVIQGSTATSSAYTILCAPFSLSTSGGSPITINTTTPITIGSDNGFETVTPTAVSTNNLGQISITATFTFAHGTGAQVSSGSFGLAEALLFVASKGGGMVAIDARWAKLGGTNATIIAATFPVNVGLWDNRYGSAYGSYVYTLTSTQVLALSTTAVQLLPAPNALSYWALDGASVVFLSGGTSYAAGGAMTIGYGVTAATNALSATISASVLTTSSTNEIIQVNGGGLTSATAGTLVLGKGIYMNTTTAFTGGSGSLQVALNVANITV